MIKLFALFCFVALTGMSCNPVRTDAADHNPLVVAQCPERPKIQDDTFGDWMSMAFLLGGMYDACRAAALSTNPRSSK